MNFAFISITNLFINLSFQFYFYLLEIMNIWTICNFGNLPCQDVLSETLVLQNHITGGLYELFYSIQDSMTQ